MITPIESFDIKHGLNEARRIAHETAVEHGFWEDKEFSVGEKLALIHSEISEALEAHRKTEMLEDEHVPGYDNFDIELADAIIRIVDLAGRLHIDIGGAVVEKMRYNQGREWKHGKEF